MKDNLKEQVTTFDQFDLDPRCLSVLKDGSIVVPTPIQAAAIPVVLEGDDVVALAQTGTGKTLGFALPALTRLTQGKLAREMMLVLVPTRELATQVHGVIEPLAKALGLTSVCIYGGVGIHEQARKLRKGANIVVATPGRLLDHMERGNVRFKKLCVLVLDEADRMLDMGFMPDIRRIVKTLPEDRQTLMFSATFPSEIERMANEIQREPRRISVGSIAKPVDSVRQIVYTVPADGKTPLLVQLVKEMNMYSALIFVRTKSRAERITKSLRREGVKAQSIHGDRSQKQREQALDGFRSGKYQLLVATDVAARGLDIDDISHVVNFDIPENPEDYIHRIGRTARAAAEGDAITFVSPDQSVALSNIEQALGKHLPRAEWDGAVSVLSLYREGSETAKKKRAGSRRRGSMLRRR